MSVLNQFLVETHGERVLTRPISEMFYYYCVKMVLLILIKRNICDIEVMIQKKNDDDPSGMVVEKLVFF